MNRALKILTLGLERKRAWQLAGLLVVYVALYAGLIMCFVGDLEPLRVFGGIGLFFYLGLTMLGLYQYKAHNRSWGMKLVVWMSGVVLLVGITARLVVYLESPLLLPFLMAGFSLAYFVGWRWVGRRLSGWKQHLVRGLAFALCLGPIAAIRCSELDNFHSWLKALPNVAFMDILAFLLYGLPGFFLVGAIGFLVSAGRELWRKADGKLTAIVLSRRAKLGYGLILLVLLLCVNWYLAAMFDIHACAFRGSKRALAYILWSRPGSVNARTMYGVTPLHRADHIEAAKMLIKAGAEVNAKDRYGVTPLHRAYHIEAAKMLIKAGAEVNAKDRYGTTPLHYAAGYRHSETAKILLEAGAEVNAKDRYGRTPLLEAASAGHPETVNALIEAGADINVKTKGGGSPLHTASWCGHIEIAKILIDAGAHMNVKDKNGRTPLDWSKPTRRRMYGERQIDPKKQAECAEFLRKHGAKAGLEIDYPFHYAAQIGRVNIVKTLIKSGANVNATIKSGWLAGWTPLHVAAHCGNTEVVKVLLKAGANVHAKAKDGRTPLDRTKDKLTYVDPKQLDECAQLLRKHGAKTGAELDAEAKQGKVEGD